MTKKLQRAISPEQKKERLFEILNNTDELFREKTYHEITLTIIAEKLGWSRGNLYKYIKTKEEIFLDLYLLKQKRFISDFAKSLKGRSNISHEEFSKLMSSSFENNLEYLKIHAIMTTIIETNVSIEKLAHFKKNSYEDRDSVFNNLSLQCPTLDTKETTELFLTILYHGCGLYACTQFQNDYIKAMELAKVPILELDFKTSYSNFILMCLDNYSKRCI